MRVTDVRTHLLTAPWSGDLAWDDWASGEFRRSSALVVIETDEGIDGVGETVMGYFRPEVVGGVTVTQQVAELAESRHVGLLVHTGASIGPSLMANLHVAFASPNARAVEIALAPTNVRDKLLLEPLELDEGDLRLPTKPGLGVRVPDGLTDDYPFESGHHEVA